MSTKSKSTTPSNSVRRGLRSSLRALVSYNNISPTMQENGKIYSPISSLAVNLSGLSTGSGEFGGTPRRKLSLSTSSVDNTPEELRLSQGHNNESAADSPVFCNSPSFQFSQSSLINSLRKNKPHSYGRPRALPLRMLESSPIPIFSLSPEHYNEDSNNERPQLYGDPDECLNSDNSVAVSEMTSSESLSFSESCFGDSQRRDDAATDVDESLGNDLDDDESHEHHSNGRTAGDSSLTYMELDGDRNRPYSAPHSNPPTFNRVLKSGSAHSIINRLSYRKEKRRLEKVSLSWDSVGEMSDLDERSVSQNSYKSSAFYPSPSGCRSSLDDDSQDSGISLEQEKDNAKFTCPLRVAPRKLRLVSEEETQSPFKYSPTKTLVSARKCSPSFSFLSHFSSMENLSGSALPDDSDCNKELSNEESSFDGFLNEISQDCLDTTPTISLSSSFQTLFTAPLRKDVGESPQRVRQVCRRLLDSSQASYQLSKATQKRLNSTKDEEFCGAHRKRRRSLLLTDSSFTDDLPIKAKTTLKRCSSESEAIIKSVLNKVADDPNLIGDGSKPYLLPVMRGRHADLKSISCDTLANVLVHKRQEVEHCVVVDCRYPYEYNGGHIAGAINLFQKKDVLNELLHQPITVNDPNKRLLLIFHCEFSAERAPALSRFLRTHDRRTNKDNYPELYYPELYLLEGGYKNFYQHHPHLCEPQSYVPMLHPDYREDLRKYRMKTRSWTDKEKMQT